MARTVQVKLIDDLDGSEASETVIFGLGQREYEVDLSEENAAKLRDALAPFVKASRRTGLGRRRRSGHDSSEPFQGRGYRARNAAIRQWAREHGHDIADRGRIPTPVLEGYSNEVELPQPSFESVGAQTDQATS